MAEPKDLEARVAGIDEKLDRLSSSVDARFQQVDERFQQVDKRFQQVDERFQQVDQRFQQVDERFDQVVRLIVEEGKATRRHFDIVAEQMKYERNRSTNHSRPTSASLD